MSNDVLIYALCYLFFFRYFIGRKAYLLAALALLDYRFYAVERTAADEENVFGIDLYEFLVRMFSSALRWNVCYCPF